MLVEIKSILREIQKQKLPWITFQLAGQYYAINSRCVSSIGLLDQACAQIPESKPHIRGLVYFRNKPARVLDLRILLGYSTLAQDLENFNQQIICAKRDHLTWIETLEKSVAERVHFPLATDPHKCEFGKWCDSYKPQNKEVAEALVKLQGPHQRLHQAAIEIEQYMKEDPQKAQGLLRNVRESHVKTIVELLDKLIQAFGGDSNELMLVMEDNGEWFAAAVDKVIGVKELELLEDSNVESILQAGYALGIAKVEGVSRPVVLLDDQALFEQAGI